eukprot:CAMPEP_0195293308 /NCGR_PEP_ID=MMETSP0707-20130614/12137_1 /TAXON_ID=33640 /ORGANISM="Asterionellopsis glacialis, Strain CCMP134" /LENGTH=459 /DNA_ID=CAMNT_0040353987 /DNA_START=75 /DNA_END=1451 /DNA_ORIENTATION=+
MLENSKEEDNFRVFVNGTQTIYARDNDLVLHKSDAEKIVSSVQLELNLPKQPADSEEEEQKLKEFAPFFKSEIILGARLARGSFSDIYEVDHFSPRQNGPQYFSLDQASARANVIALTSRDGNASIVDKPAFISNNGNGDGALKLATNTNKFVVKHLRPDLVFSPDDFHAAAISLVKEAKMLSSLQHPNIVTLQGISFHGPSGYAQGHPDGYFLVLDRLTETLDDRIKAWRKKQNKHRRRNMPRLSGSKNGTYVIECLKVLTCVADALAYLHEKAIIHRDLKLDNLVFDAHDNIQIIDFGFSRELPISKASASHAREDETYHLTGNTGTMRYMAPEVYFRKPYNAKADIYSFALIMYSAMALKTKVFPELTPSQMKEQVYEQATRPCFSSSIVWPDGICKLIEKCWSNDHALRPTSRVIHHGLINFLENEEKKLQPSSSKVPQSSDHRQKLSMSLRRAW